MKSKQSLRTLLVCNNSPGAGTSKIRQYTLWPLQRRIRSPLGDTVTDVRYQPLPPIQRGESDWGFNDRRNTEALRGAVGSDKGRPMVENDAVNVTAYVRIYKDPTGVLAQFYEVAISALCVSADRIKLQFEEGDWKVGLQNQGATCYLLIPSTILCTFTNAPEGSTVNTMLLRWTSLNK